MVEDSNKLDRDNMELVAGDRFEVDPRSALLRQNNSWRCHHSGRIKSNQGNVSFEKAVKKQAESQFR